MVNATATLRSLSSECSSLYRRTWSPQSTLRTAGNDLSSLSRINLVSSWYVDMVSDSTHADCNASSRAIVFLWRFDGNPRDSGVGADKYVGNPLKIRGTAPGLRLTVFLSTLKLMKKILMKIGYLEVQLSFWTKYDILLLKVRDNIFNIQSYYNNVYLTCIIIMNTSLKCLLQMLYIFLNNCRNKQIAVVF